MDFKQLQTLSGATDFFTEDDIDVFDIICGMGAIRVTFYDNELQAFYMVWARNHGVTHEEEIELPKSACVHEIVLVLVKKWYEIEHRYEY